LEINNLGYTADRESYRPQLVTYLRQHESSLCANCQRRIEVNPLRVLDCKVPECRAMTEAAPRLADSLSEAAHTYFTGVLQGLDLIHIPYSLNHRLVRGLDYYNLTTFEVTATNLGAQNAVGAGGRYDSLVETLSGPSTPAVGFAVGLERIAMLLPESALRRTAAKVVVYVAAFGDQGSVAGFSALEDLRASGIPAVLDFRSSTLKAHLRQADRLACGFTLILGDDEVQKGTAILRNMVTKSQYDLPLSSLPAAIQPLLGSA